MEKRKSPGVTDYEETLRLLRQQADTRELKALRERDEARNAVWEILMYYCNGLWWSEVCEMFPQYPWLNKSTSE